MVLMKLPKELACLGRLLHYHVKAPCSVESPFANVPTTTALLTPMKPKHHLRPVL